MPLRDRPLPPQRDDLHPGSDDDPGAMGINYRCEPMVERWSRPEQSITAVSAPWRKTAGKKPSSPHRGRRPSGSSSCSPTVATACWTKTAISSRPRSRAWNPEKRAATKPRTTRTPGKRATTTAQSGSSTVCKGSPLIYKVFNSHVHGDPATPVFQTIFPIGTGAKTPHPCRLLGVFWPIASQRNCCGKRLGIL